MNESLETLKSIEKLLRTLVKHQFKNVLTEELSDKRHAKIYELTGESSRDEIAKLTGLSTASISRLWQKWEEIGLIEKQGQVYKKIL